MEFYRLDTDTKYRLKTEGRTVTINEYIDTAVEVYGMRAVKNIHRMLGLALDAGDFISVRFYITVLFMFIKD